VSALEARLRRLEDVEAIRNLDAAYCRLIDTGDWPGLVALFTADGPSTGWPSSPVRSICWPSSAALPTAG
jgi:hypothetical protein